MPGYRLIFTPEAREDVLSAALYYDDQLPGLGKIFRGEVKRQLLLLKQNPYTRSVRYDNVRFAVTRKFPYSIHYTINERLVIIAAVLCDYRDHAEHWKL